MGDRGRAASHRRNGLACLVLRTARFFPELDDDPEIRAAFEDANLKANDYLYRRVDLQDVVDAHLLALAKAPALGFARCIVSAPTPFSSDDLVELRVNAPRVVARDVPEYGEEYARRGWRMLQRIGRVYVNERARRELGWHPRYDVRHVLDCLRAGRSP